MWKVRIGVVLVVVGLMAIGEQAVVKYWGPILYVAFEFLKPVFEAASRSSEWRDGTGYDDDWRRISIAPEDGLTSDP